MEIKTLKNPPIKEALLEIRFNPNKNVTVSKLNEFADSLSSIYPKKEPVENQQIAFMFSKEHGPQHDVNIQSSGFKLTNTQGNCVIIATIDKFVVSFLSSYAPWPDLKDTANDLYNKYLNYAPQTEIIRLGMRYINNVNFPLTEDFSFQQYINTFQPLPIHSELPGTLSKFENVVVMLHADIECTSTTRQILLDAEVDSSGKPIFLPFVLDIDVYQSKIIEDIESDEIWGTFEKMRSKKNAIFFGTFTEKAIAPYE